MLNALVSFSLRYRGVIVALALLVAGYGVLVASRSKFDVYPEFTPPIVTVQTEAPGLSPEQVEQLVTRPVENAINGVAGVETIRSQSIQGLSVVTTVFKEGTDIYRARQVVGEVLGQVTGDVPTGVKPPSIAPLTSATSMILSIGLTSDQRSLMELRTLADWTLTPRLLAVPGVAKIAVFGGEVRQIQVRYDPAKLLAHELSLDELTAAAGKATGVVGTGFMDTPNQRIVVQAEGQSLTPEQLGEAVVRQTDTAPVRIKDVAAVADGVEPRLGDALIQGKPGVILVVSSQYQSNTLVVTEAVDRALAELKPALDAQGVTIHPALFRPANFIQTALTNVKHALLLGGVMVAVVLTLFLWNWRTAFISLTSIPLSLLAAAIVLDARGISLNTMTLAGLAIAIGVVVDDAVIDVENIFRRLRLNAASPTPRSIFAVILDASLEVRSAVIYATFVVILVFLPVVLMSGVQGRLFAPLGIAYILATTASLLVALTITPALCMLMLPGRLAAHEAPFAGWLKRRYSRLLEGAMALPKTIIATVLVLFIASAAMIPFFGGAFLPEFREGAFIVHTSAVPGTSLAESRRTGALISAALLKHPKVASVSQKIGRAEKADDIWGTHYSEIEVVLKPIEGEEAEAIQSEIRAIMAEFPGTYFAIKPFLAERIEETLTGSTAQVVVKVFGDNLDQIDTAAKAVSGVLSSITGAADVQEESPPGLPEVIVRLRPDRLRLYGFSPVEVMQALRTANQGVTVAQTFEGSRVVDVVVVEDPALRSAPEQLAGLLVANAGGQHVRLSELAQVYQDNGRYSIAREGARRRQAVTCNVRGRDVASFVQEARAKIAADVALPPGAYVEFAGTAEAQTQARQDLLIQSLMVGVGIVLLLAIVFKSGRNLAVVLANMPFALVGGVLAVFATGGWLTVGSMVGFVTLFGISTRNSIMMISHLEHLVMEEGQEWPVGHDAASKSIRRATALRGAGERLVPVLMTALVTGLGLLPIAIGSGDPGKEIEGPMAIVILGGLVSSTVLNLLVLPSIAAMVCRFDAELKNVVAKGGALAEHDVIAKQL